MARWHFLAAAAGIALPAIGCGGEPSDSSIDLEVLGPTSIGETVEPSPAPLHEVFVNPSAGDDANPGTSQAPFRTLKAAFEQAFAGQSIRLQAGTYSVESGEDWATAVPPGVRLSAVTPGQAVLSGTPDTTALRFEGDSDVRSLVIRGFAEGLSASAGTHAWSEIVLLDNGTGIQLAGDADVAGTDLDIASAVGGTVTAFAVRGSASLLLQDSAIHDLGAGCGHGNVGSVSQAARFTATGLDVRDADGGLAVRGAAVVTLLDSEIERVGTNGCGNGEAIAVGEAATLTLQDVGFRELRAEAVLVDGVGRAFLHSATIETNKLPGLVVRGGSADVEASTFDAFDSTHGAALAMSGARLSITGTAFKSCSTCVVVDGGSVSVRGSQFEDAGVAIDVASGSVDLGNADDPGENAFATIKGTALLVRSQDAPTIPAGGNFWRKAQGAVLGLYASGTAIEGPAGCADETPRNYCIEHSATVAF